MLRLTLFLCALLPLLPQRAFAAGAIESISRIRGLSIEEAARGQPVSVEAVVTFRDPGQAALIADDGREGIYVALPKDGTSAIQTGCRVRIEGVTEPGGFIPIIQGRGITLLGTASRPEPRLLNPSDLFSPALDCQWVQIPATITGVEADRSGTVLLAEVSGWTVKVLLPELPEQRERAAALMQRPVTVRGVVGSVFNSERQLTGRHFFVSSFDDVVPSENAMPDGEPSLRPTNELLRSDANSRTRVRVRGIVTHVTGEGLYVRGEGGSIFVRAASVGGLKPGTSVEAEGFAAVAPFRPILRATQVRPLGQALVPQPEPLKFLGDALARQQAELVTADVDLLAHHPGPEGGVVLQCRAGRWFFEAELPPASALSARLNDNDRLRLVGICELTSTKPLAFANTADGFRLHLRSATDVVVLRRAPWWTLRRLIWALAAAGGVALVALTWVALLRRRVAEQTRTIGAQLQRAAVKDERQRIARELHDTIEQELAGVSLQLRNARQRLAQSPAAAGTSLELAEKMLRHCRDEARTSIRDLRSVALEQRGLRGALEEFVAPLAMESAAHFTLDVQGHPRPLAGTAEIHLLRIAQEATANAVRHANASEINVRLAYDADTVTLEVRDNGCGFDPAAPAPRGHFGILGIHERANKLHAKLAIESAAGTGTVIRVIVPANTALPSPDPVL